MNTQKKALGQGIDVFDMSENIPGRRGIKVNMEKQARIQAGEEIYFYHKRGRIEEDLKLDVSRILKIDEDYGPLDWRLHQAHTIYWAAEDEFEEYMKGGVNYAKIIRQSMIESFYEGRLFHNPVKNVVTRTNNLEIIGKIHDYVEYLRKNQFSQKVDKIHQDFLYSAIAILFTFNQQELSHELFEHYKEDYLKGKEITYEAFIMKSLKKVLSWGRSGGKRGSLVEAALFKSFEWLETRGI